MEKLVKIPVCLALLIAIVCHSHALLHDRIPQHHKVRHKHNILHFRDNHVNEIREAFDDYKNTVYKPKGSRVSFNDAIKLKSLRHHGKNHEKLNDDLTESASDDRIVNDETSLTYPKGENIQFMTRYKRVHETETTTKTTTTTQAAENLSDNYDEEYDDDEAGEKKNMRVSDGSGVKVQETAAAGQTLTNYKLEMLSTRESVQKSFARDMNSQRNNQQEIVNNYDQGTIFKRIRENMMRTKIDGMCRWPNKKVIEMPQHASKMYTPRKYVVHRCSDDTACCGSGDKTCVAKRTENLVLWFHVRYVGSTGYESLKVQNHTECECSHKSRQTPAPTRHFAPSHVSHALPRTTTRRARTQHCKCPSHFDVEVDDGTCGCFCRNGKPECRQRYEGKEGFTISDQRCIKQQECSQPHCLYGTYSSNSGRCPDKNEKIRRGFQRPK